MDINEVLSILNNYGILIIFIIMFLEGLNLTGIPSAVLLPSIGVFIDSNNFSFITSFLLAFLASILANLIFYFIAYKFGSKIFDYIYNKFPRLQKGLNKTINISEKYGAKACLIGRLIPTVRTCISLIAGVFKINLRDFILYSSIGIFIWDFVLIFLGYLIPISY